MDAVDGGLCFELQLPTAENFICGLLHEMEASFAFVARR